MAADELSLGEAGLVGLGSFVDDGPFGLVVSTVELMKPVIFEEVEGELLVRVCDPVEELGSGAATSDAYPRNRSPT